MLCLVPMLVLRFHLSRAIIPNRQDAFHRKPSNELSTLIPCSTLSTRQAADGGYCCTSSMISRVLATFGPAWLKSARRISSSLELLLCIAWQRFINRYRATWTGGTPWDPTAQNIYT